MNGCKPKNNQFYEWMFYLDLLVIIMIWIRRKQKCDNYKEIKSCRWSKEKSADLKGPEKCLIILQNKWFYDGNIYTVNIYSGELGCRIVLIHGVHPTPTYGLKKVTCALQAHTLANVIDLPANLREVIWKGFLTQLVKRMLLPNPPVPSGHQPVTSMGTEIMP